MKEVLNLNNAREARRDNKEIANELAYDIEQILFLIGENIRGEDNIKELREAIKYQPYDLFENTKEYPDSVKAGIDILNKKINNIVSEHKNEADRKEIIKIAFSDAINSKLLRGENPEIFGGLVEEIAAEEAVVREKEQEIFDEAA